VFKSLEERDRKGRREVLWRIEVRNAETPQRHPANGQVAGGGMGDFLRHPRRQRYMQYRHALGRLEEFETEGQPRFAFFGHRIIQKLGEKEMGHDRKSAGF